MIEIKHRWTEKVLFTSQTAKTVAEAMAEARKSGADLSGAYLSGAGMAAGDTWWITITAAGHATASTGAPPTSDYGQIQRLGDGSFATAPWSIPTGEYEQATAPADLSTMKLESTRFGVLYGRVIFALVQVSSG